MLYGKKNAKAKIYMDVIMSESVVRIPAQQSLFNATSNLVDLIIPGNTGVYDLSQTYVSLLTRVTSNSPALPALIVGTDDGVYDVRVHMKHQLGAADSIYDDCATPIECLVNSCSMISAVKGGIEDIRKSDVLRGTMSVYKEDLDSRQAKALTTWSGACKDQPWVHGQHVELRGEGTVDSREVTHEIRFNLRDLFDAGQFEAWDSSVYGDTRIHLELNLAQVSLTQCQGSTDITWTSAYQQRVQADGTTPDILNFGYATVGKGGATALPHTLANTTGVFAATSALEMKTPYDSLADCPFWVGQDVSITPSNTGAAAQNLIVSVPEAAATGNQTLAAGAVGDAGRAVITSIDFDNLTGLVTLNFAGTVLECPTQGATESGILSVIVTGTDVSAAAGEVPAITYEACELVATMRSDMQMGQAPKAHQFSRFVFQGDQFTNTSGIQRTYQIPANCTAVLMAITNTQNGHSSFLGSARVNDYRFSVDGEAVTNRAVTYAELSNAGNFKGKWGSSLHYDLLQKTFLNMGPNARYQSMTESVFDQKIPVDQPGDAGTAIGDLGQPGWSTSAADPEKSAFLIGVPIPLKADSSQLLLELNGSFTDGASINIYSYVQVVV